MKGASRYRTMFENLEIRGEIALIPFLVLGDPDPETFLVSVEAVLEGGGDALELGLPFSDPVADGPAVQEAVLRAMRLGGQRERFMKLLAQARRRAGERPIGLLAYGNSAWGSGLDRFYSEVAEAGADSVLVADVPTLEAAPFAEAAARHGVAPVLIAPPNAREESLRQIAVTTRGYTYVVTRAGVTGVHAGPGSETAGLVRRLKALNAPPPVLGFGIARPEHVEMARESGAAGAICGSAIVAQVARYAEDPKQLRRHLCDFVRAMKGATCGSGGQPIKPAPILGP